MNISNDWQDYECLDAGNGEKLERWGKIILRRPDPAMMWETKIDGDWLKADAVYHRSSTGGGAWEYKKKIPATWTIQYKDLTFKISPTNFKHTGLFPEQASNWDFMMAKIKAANRPIKVLNLFAYTGGATMACAKAGADLVVQVDSSEGMKDWAKENMHLCHLDDKHIRFIVDDCQKFVDREARRGNKYDAIIMDPPSYGRGPNGEVWKFERSLSTLLASTLKILSDKPLFILINAYATDVSSMVLYNMLKIAVASKYGGEVSAGEVGLPITKNGLILPCGMFGRWESHD